MVVKSGDGEGPPDALPDEHRGTSILPSPIGVALKPWQSSSAQIQKSGRCFTGLNLNWGVWTDMGAFVLRFRVAAFGLKYVFLMKLRRFGF